MMTSNEIVEMLENYLKTKPGEWKWEDFTQQAYADPVFEHFLAVCISYYEEYPSENPGQPCNEKGIEIIRNIISKLQKIDS